LADSLKFSFMALLLFTTRYMKWR